MGALVSDNLQKIDCVRCRVSQEAQFGEGLCAGCHFRQRTDARLREIMDAQTDRAIRFWARALAWALASVLCGAAIFLISLWK